MTSRSTTAWLHDIVEAIGNIRAAMQDVSPESFEADWQKRWVVERGVENVESAHGRGYFYP
jgi:uncharacterized protein with HEPN domain